MKPNRICCIGADQGGPTGCVIAHKCPEIRVTVLDNEKIISNWNSDKIMQSQADLEEILKKCRNRNLFFSTDYSNLKDADMVFISIKTPLKSKGCGEGQTFDLKPIEDAARLITAHSETDKIVVERSRVPFKAAESVATILQSRAESELRYQVLSNPEFASEGSVIQDLLNPRRVVIGCQNNPNSRNAVKSLCSLYERWVPRKNIITTSLWEAEIGKICSNLFLAQRIAGLNLLIEVCESIGVDISVLSAILKKDSKIGDSYLNPSFGFGGFREEILTLMYMCEGLKIPEIAEYWGLILELNDRQKMKFLDKINGVLQTVKHKKLAIWGFSYKENTEETKYSPAVDLCKALLSEGATLRIYDPKVPSAKIFKELNFDPNKAHENLQVSKDAYDACNGANAIVLCTPWSELQKLDFQKILETMKKPARVFDGRKFLSEELMKNCGFEYHTIGVKNKVEVAAPSGRIF